MKRYKAVIDTELLSDVPAFWDKNQNIWISEKGGTWFKAHTPQDLLEQIASHFGLVVDVSERKENQCGAV